MAFFCDKSGVRIVAPGISLGVGGDVLEHDGSDEAIAAERAAERALAAGPPSPAAAPGPVALRAAASAASAVMRVDRPAKAPERTTSGQKARLEATRPEKSTKTEAPKADVAPPKAVDDDAAPANPADAKNDTPPG